MLVGTDRQVASAVGVSPWRAKIFAFALAGGCAGVAGALTAPLYTTPPGIIGYTAFNSLFYLAVPVLAGFRSLLGVAVVAMAFLVIPQALESYHISAFTLGAVGLLLGTATGRGGLSGMILDRLHGWKRNRRAPTLDVRTLCEVATGANGADRAAVHQRALAVLEDYFPERRDGATSSSPTTFPWPSAGCTPCAGCPSPCRQATSWGSSGPTERARPPCST